MAIIKKFRIKSFKNINSIIEFENISLSYGNRQILENINFKINEGQIFGMLGPNGVGKSTIFNLITGLINPGNGKIKIAGEDVSKYPVYLRTKKFKVGYVPQYGGYFNDLTLQDNLKAISEIVIENKNYRSERINYLITKFELDNLKDIKAKFLSGGQKKKLVISMALINDPSILLLDEPFAGVDPIAVEEIQDIVSSLKRKNIGVLITDHNVKEALSIVEYGYIIYNGEIIKSGSPQEITSDKFVKKIYLGKNYN